MSAARFAATLLVMLFSVVCGFRAAGARGPWPGATAATRATLYRVSNGTARERLVADSGLDVPVGSERFRKLFPHGLPSGNADTRPEVVRVSTEELPACRDGRRLLRIEGVLPSSCVRPTIVILPASLAPGYRVVVRRGPHPRAHLLGVAPFTIVLELPRWAKPASGNCAPPR